MAVISQAFRYVLMDLPDLVCKGKPVQSRIAVAPLHLLPAWLVEADRLWLDMTGRPIGLELVDRPAAPLQAVVDEAPSMVPVSALLMCLTYTARELVQHNDKLVLDPLMERFEARRRAYLSPAPLIIAPRATARP